MVDDEDFERVSKFKWHANKIGNTYYALRSLPLANGRRPSQLMHQFIMPGFPKIDHRDRNGLNNQQHNLRPASSSSNQQNRIKKQNNPTSKFKGVCWATGSKRWQADIGHNGRTIRLGRFLVETEAAKAYDEAAVKLFGEFALTNKMLGLL